MTWLREWPAAEEIRSPVQWVMAQEIAFHFDEHKGYAHPGIDRLAKRSRYSEKTCRRALDQLDDDGVIHRQTSLGRVTKYRLPHYRQDGIPSTDPGQSDLLSDTEPCVNPGQSDRTPRSESPPTPVAVTAHPGQSDRLSRGKESGKESEVDVKPLRGQPKVMSHPTAKATPGQLAFLADLNIFETGFPLTTEQHERDAELTQAQAVEEIKNRWATLEAEGWKQVLARIPTAMQARLSEAGQAQLERAARGAAA